jgi:uncharacterized membrane protein YfcA
MSNEIVRVSPTVITYGAVCIFLAPIVRGYSGFGFSLLAVTALSLVLPPAVIVPSIFLLEIAASLHLLPGIWKDIHWRSIGPLTLGCLAATPMGVHFLANVPAAPMQVAIACFVLLATLLLWRGYALKSMPGPVAATAAGAAAGLANGAFGMAGPPVVLFYFGSPAGNVAGRASLIAFFIATDTIGLTFLWREGLVTPEAAIRALTFLPPLIAGVWLGARIFRSADPAVFRRWVLIILASLAVLTAILGISRLGT